MAQGRLAIVTLLLLFCAIPAFAATLPADGIAAALGVKVMAQGDVLKANWPRSDVNVNVDEVPLPPAAGLTSWVAFKAAPQGAMVMGDTVVFQDEVDAAMDAALANGLRVTALHNHFFYDQPKVYFLHIDGMGAPQQLAQEVRKVWDAIKMVRKQHAQPAEKFGGAPPAAGNPDEAQIARIIGREAKVKDGVVKAEIGRNGKMDGVDLGDAMGLNTWAAFQGSDEAAVVDGDFIMTGDEVQPVLKAMRKGGIHIVALHNHMVGEEPRFFFLHYWGKGRATDLARTVRSALDAQAAAGGK